MSTVSYLQWWPERMPQWPKNKRIKMNEWMSNLQLLNSTIFNKYNVQQLLLFCRTCSVQIHKYRSVYSMRALTWWVSLHWTHVKVVGVKWIRSRLALTPNSAMYKHNILHLWLRLHEKVILDVCVSVKQEASLCKPVMWVENSSPSSIKLRQIKWNMDFTVSNSSVLKDLFSGLKVSRRY